MLCEVYGHLFRDDGDFKKEQLEKMNGFAQPKQMAL